MRYKVQLITPIGVLNFEDLDFNKLAIKGTREKGYLFDFKESMSAKLTLSKEDYKHFKTLETSNLRYNEIYIKVKKEVNGFDKIEIDGVVPLYKCKFNDDHCTVDLAIVIKDNYLLFNNEADSEYNLLNTYFGVQLFALYECSHPSINGKIKNGVLLQDVIQEFYSRIAPNKSVISNVLCINKPKTGFYHTIILYQKSDAVRRNIVGYNPATKFTVTFNQILHDICTKLNLYYTIDSNGDLLIDDYIYMPNTTQVVDLTAPPNKDQVFFNNEWEFKNGDIFSKEIYKDGEVADGIVSPSQDFAGEPIEYPNAIASSLNKASEEEYEISFICDAWHLAIQDPNNFGGGLDGGLMVAVDLVGTDYEILSTTPVNDTSPSANNVLSWGVVHDTRFKNRGRSFKSGIMNTQPTTFTNIKKTKLQKGVKFKECTDYRANLYGSFLTDLGVGEVGAYDYDFIEKTLKLDLLYEVEDSNIITAPTVVDDYYYTTQNVPLSSPTPLTANDSIVGSVEAENKITSQGGQVSIYSNGNFLYTPPINFYGQDNFDYIAKNGNLSTGLGNVTIGVRPPNVYVKFFQVVKNYFISQSFGYLPYYELRARWFADPLMNIPLDVTNFGITLYWYYQGGSTFNYQNLGVGSDQLLFQVQNGFNMSNYYITSHPDYIIIP